MTSLALRVNVLLKFCLAANERGALVRRRARVFSSALFVLVGMTQLLSVLPARANGELPPIGDPGELPPIEKVDALPPIEKVDALPPVEEVPLGGGTISISVFGDLGACASVSFNDVQLEAAGTLSALGAGTTYDGSVSQVSAADNQSGANVSSLPDMCVPGDPTLNAAEVTFQANAAGFNRAGVVTTMSATTTCVFLQVGGATCTPQVTAVVPPSPAR